MLLMGLSNNPPWNYDVQNTPTYDNTAAGRAIGITYVDASGSPYTTMHPDARYGCFINDYLHGPITGSPGSWNTAITPHQCLLPLNVFIDRD